MAPKLTDKEREKIVALLREHGGNQNKVARISERSVKTVHKIAHAEGIESNISAPKKANNARRDYALAGRLELNNELFDKLRVMARRSKDPGEFRDLVVSYGVLTDKRRLDDGEATSRTESVDPEARRRVREGLDELARRRRMAGGG